MYGISTVYQRLKGTVPPSTEQHVCVAAVRAAPGAARRPDPGRAATNADVSSCQPSDGSAISKPFRPPGPDPAGRSCSSTRFR